MSNFKNVKKRSVYIDIVKGFAIIAVVLLHVDFTWPQYKLLHLNSILGWLWHVPVFFCIGGFFIKEEKLQNPISFIKNKFRSLYLLALYIYFPATLLHNFLFKINWYSSEAIYGGKIINEWSLQEYIINCLKTLLCAGREPIMGAMWFVYTLLFALCGLSIISYLVKKCTKNEKQYEWTRFILLLALQIISCIATSKFNFTIPRFSNAITVMLLIYLGEQINNRFKLQFDNWGCAIFSLLIFYQTSILFGDGIIGLNNNAYHDALQLTISCCAATYLLCFIAKKIEHSKIGKLIAVCGKESFYIMGLHIVGFKLCSTILIQLGYINGGLEQLMTPAIENNLFLLLIYTTCGVIIPIIVITLVRKIKLLILKN